MGKGYVSVAQRHPVWTTEIALAKLRILRLCDCSMLPMAYDPKLEQADSVSEDMV